MSLRSPLAVTGLGFVLALSAACSSDGPSRGEDGAIEGEGSISAFDFEVGDCFDDPEDLELGTLSTAVDLAALPCDEPHDNEAFALIDLEGADDEFPGVDTISEEGRELCLAEFEPHVGIDHDTSALEFDAYLTPTEETWEAGDREVVCAVYNGDLSPLTGSVKGIAE